MQRPERFPRSKAAGWRQGSPEILFPVGAGAVSGAIAGFLLAGHVALGISIFLSLLLGIVAGWWARGLVDKSEQKGAP